MKQLVALVSALSIFSCKAPPTPATGSTGDSAAVTAKIPPLEGGSENLFRYRWYFSEVRGEAISLPADTAQLLFYPGQLSTVRGSTGCNSLNASFVLANSHSIRFSPVATTKRMCAGSNAATEAAILQALSDTKYYSVNDETLRFYNDSVLLAVLKPSLTAASQASQGHNDDAASETEIRGGGNEPFWSLEVNKKTGIHFRLVGGDSLHADYVAPVRLPNAAGNSYRVVTPDGILKAVVYDRICINDMSGDSLPKALEVSWKNLKLKGCGR